MILDPRAEVDRYTQVDSDQRIASKTRPLRFMANYGKSNKDNREYWEF